MTEYLLPKHVYCCAKGDAVVFLDLKRDKYQMVRGAEARAFRSLLLDRTERNLRSGLQEDTSGDVFVTDQGPLDSLVIAGLLTTHREDGKAISPTYIPSATERLIEPEDLGSVHIRVPHVSKFLVSCGTRMRSEEHTSELQSHLNL